MLIRCAIKPFRKAAAPLITSANHPNFDLPDRIFDSGTFAALRSANGQGNEPPRQIQIGLRYWF